MEGPRVFTLAAAALAALFGSMPTLGFVFTEKDGHGTLNPTAAIRWPRDVNPVMELQLGAYSGRLLDGSASFDAAFEAALAGWNDALDGVNRAPQFLVQRESTAAKGRFNGLNNVFLADRVYGEPWGAKDLAITLWQFDVHDDRYPYLVEADVIFNSTVQWDSYEGPSRPGLYDLIRVGLHEAGHVLGLNHPDEASPRQVVDAIMNSEEGGPLDWLRDDDIRGARALYSLERPGPPGGVSASASGSVINVTWSRPATGGEPTNYVIEVGGSSGATFLTVPTDSTQTTFSRSGFTVGTYYVRVKGVNWAGTGSPSTETSVTVRSTECTPPGMPTMTVITNINRTLVLGWTAPSGSPTGYVLYSATRTIRDEDLDGSSVEVDNLGNRASATFVDVTPGTYHLRLRAWNACGLGPASTPEIVVTISSGTQPPTDNSQDIVYSGQFTGTFQQVYRAFQGTCTWQFRYTGRMTFTLRSRSDGTITGTMKVTNSMQNAGPGSSSDPIRLQCSAFSFSGDRTATVSGTWSNIRWSDSSWSFSGQVSGNNLTGRMTAIRNDSTYTNTGTIQVTLPKQ